MLGLGLSLTSRPVRGNGAGSSLDLNLLTATADTLDRRITFSRAGIAWQYDSAGTLVTVPHNLLTHSAEFANSAWTKTQSTVSGNVLANPLDGAVSADKLLENTTTNVHDILQSVSFVAGNQYTLSFYAKAAERDRLRVFLLLGAFGVTVTIRFNLAAGTVTANTAGTNGSSSITAVGGGWYRCVVSAQATTTASANVLIRLENAAGADNYLGDGVSGIHLFGVQCEQHGSARPYLGTSVRNLLGYTEAFDVAAWPKTRVGVTANATTAPDGTLSADKVTEQTDTATNRQIRQDIAVTSGATYGISVYAKAAERSGINLRFGSGFAAGNVTFDLSAGTLTSGGTVSASSITAMGNGWYRCFCAFPATSSTTAGAQIFIHNGSSITYDGVAGNGVYLWGAQVSASGSLDPYVPTFAAAPSSAAYHGPAFDYAYNGTSWVAQGLRIEEARTNLFAGDLTVTGTWPSVAIARASGATAPDGTTNGVTVTENASGTTSYGFNSASTTITASAAATASIFVKPGTCTFLRLILSDATTATIAAQAWFNLTLGAVGTNGVFTSTGGTPTGISATISNVGGGWYRCTLTATLATATTGFLLCRMTSADNVSSDAGSKTMSFFGPQLEVGAFATSPILTTTASATRATDVAVIQPLGSWFNASEGTLFVEFQTAATGTNLAAQISDNSYNNRILAGFDSTAFVGQCVVGGVATLAPTSKPLRTTGIAKLAFAWATNNAQLAGNGASAVADVSGAVPTGQTRLDIGGDHGGANRLSGHIRKLRYLPRRASNVELQALTT